ncbi:hypothetical protein AX15_004542 [Amanita polypyramis BW_CC]|nr:hypothetical protein AX15_004542 [Amanita polypyramis BW_CC]
MNIRGEKHEIWWRSHRELLESFGYKLRRNLFPDFYLDQGNEKMQYNPIMLMDATRIVDGRRVMLKRVGQKELEIAVFFKYSHETITNDRRNHCVPVFDVLEVPDEEETAIVVIPFLRPSFSPRFETRGELLEFFRQILEGVHFMHMYNVVYRDCTVQNILMEGDGLYPQGFHPVWFNRTLTCSGPAKQRFNRTRRPPTYYLTGFGPSCYFPATTTDPLAFPSSGGIPLPEHQEQSTLYDPFTADVYDVGNAILAFLHGRKTQENPICGFQFLIPLLEDMTHQDANERPTMEGVVARYNRILKMQSKRSLRSRVFYEGDRPPSIARRLCYWGRQILFAMRGLSALPTPK